MEKSNKKHKGFLNPKIVRAVSFYIIITCIIFSVLLSILVIWDAYEDKHAVFWKMVATLGIIAVGSAVFSYINGIFGSDE